MRNRKVRLGRVNLTILFILVSHTEFVTPTYWLIRMLWLSNSRSFKLTVVKQILKKGCQSQQLQKTNEPSTELTMEKWRDQVHSHPQNRISEETRLHERSENIFIPSSNFIYPCLCFHSWWMKSPKIKNLKKNCLRRLTAHLTERNGGSGNQNGTSRECDWLVLQLILAL